MRTPEIVLSKGHASFRITVTRGRARLQEVHLVCAGGRDVIRKEAWPFDRTISGVCLCWKLEEPQRSIPDVAMGSTLTPQRSWPGPKGPYGRTHEPTRHLIDGLRRRRVAGVCTDRIGTGPPRARTELIYVDRGFGIFRARSTQEEIAESVSNYSLGGTRTRGA